MWHSILTAFAKVIAVPTVLFMSLAGYNTQVLSPSMATQEAQYLQHSQQVFAGTQPFAGGTYNLAGAGVSNTATTIILTSLTIKQTGQLIQTSDLVGTGGTFYVTLEPGSPTKQEIVGCTAVAQNGTSASLTGCSRGLSPISPYTASTTLQFTHGGGTQVIFSDPPQLFNQYGALANTNVWTGYNSFSVTSKPSYSSNPSFGASDGNAFVNYSTLLSTAISGAGTSTEGAMGISQLATSAQVSAGTASSTEGRPLVIKSGSATSTCQVAAPGVLAASSTTGKLDTRCFDATQAYSFSNSTGISIASSSIGNITAGVLTATSTTASSTIQNLVVNTNATTTNLRVSNNVQLPTSASSIISAAISTTTTFAAPTASGASAGKSIQCLSPKIAISGGWAGIPVSGGASSIVMTQSQNNVSNVSQWDFTAGCNTSGTCTSGTITVYAMCINP